MLKKTIIYTFVLSFTFGPLSANNASKGALSQEDIENIANCIIEKLKEKNADPEQIEKNIENYIAIQSHPSMQEFRLKQMIQDLSNPQVKEARSKQINETLDFFKSRPMLAYVPLIAVTAISGISFGIGVAVGKSH